MASSSNSEETSTNVAPDFLIVNPGKGRKRDLLKYLATNNVESGKSFIESSSEGIKSQAVKDHRLIILISIILRKILMLVNYPMMYFGDIFYFSLNLLAQNNGFFGTISNFFSGKLKIPQKGSADYISIVGHVDPRIELYKRPILSEKVDDYVVSDVLGDKYIMDLCVMSAKLAYENATVIQNVVENYWKMHFVGFYNRYSASLQKSNTEVFICCDKEKDAELIVVSFRGTEIFSTEDYCIDLDFSWFQIPKVGKVHMGFLEAMGLGERSDPESFQTHLSKHETDFFHIQGDAEAKMKKFAETRAFYAVALTLRDLLNEHKNAKFVVTGHSLGGALAILFPCALVVQEEAEMLNRLLNVYTIGQPRIGDSKFAGFMEAHLNYPATRYFRSVYCNDMIPRIPFDDQLFAYKHFGMCIYYDSFYFGKFVEEEPNKNFFSFWYLMKMWSNAWWELFRGRILKYVYGEDYKETWVMTLFRLVGLIMPNAPAHCPPDYVNSVRLGRGKPSSSFTLKSLINS